MQKVEEYYDKTATTHAYIFVMSACSFPSFFVMHNLIFLIVLGPEIKMNHFMKHWTKPLQDKVMESTETIVCYFSYIHIPFYLFLIV